MTPLKPAIFPPNSLKCYNMFCNSYTDEGKYISDTTAGCTQNTNIHHSTRHSKWT